MQIQHHDRPRDLLHPIWCDPACHDDTQVPDYHRTEHHTLDLILGGTARVWVDQSGDAPPEVVVEVAGDTGLAPMDTRALARLLLAAADIADGSAVTW